ncbi:MAG: GNAT family N-acetyltransferase [Chitinophagaceae bacterium]|nr:MAG: GNAT family N-acetyltransferase [Chitinophagaceae bacterium]
MLFYDTPLETKIDLLNSITAEQASEISTLSHQLGYKTSADETLSRVRKIIAKDDECIFIGVQGETIVGWIHAFFTVRVETEPFVEIAGLVVHEAYRKKQIGRNLIDAVCIWAQPHHCSQIRVRCNEIRSETHRFYRNLGFTLEKKQLIFALDSSRHAPKLHLSNI